MQTSWSHGTANLVPTSREQGRESNRANRKACPSLATDLAVSLLLSFSFELSFIPVFAASSILQFQKMSALGSGKMPAGLLFEWIAVSEEKERINNKKILFFLDKRNFAGLNCRGDMQAITSLPSIYKA
jgi:hypothetical protein